MKINHPQTETPRRSDRTEPGPVRLFECMGRGPVNPVRGNIQLRWDSACSATETGRSQTNMISLIVVGYYLVYMKESGLLTAHLPCMQARHTSNTRTKHLAGLRWCSTQTWMTRVRLSPAYEELQSTKRFETNLLLFRSINSHRLYWTKSINTEPACLFSVFCVF